MQARISGVSRLYLKPRSTLAHGASPHQTVGDEQPSSDADAPDATCNADGGEAPRTLLHAAVERGLTEIAAALLAAGAVKLPAWSAADIAAVTDEGAEAERVVQWFLAGATDRVCALFQAPPDRAAARA